MKTLNSVCLLSVLALIVGCVPPQNKYSPHTFKTPSTRQAVYGKTTVTSDPYNKSSWIKSPAYTSNYIAGSGKLQSSKLRAYVKNKEVVHYQFYASDSDKNRWRFFDSAYDSQGTKLKFHRIDREVSKGAWTNEIFAIDLSREYLEGALSAGLNIKVYGKRNNQIFRLPGLYIAGFLDKVDFYTGKKPHNVINAKTLKYEVHFSSLQGKKEFVFLPDKSDLQNIKKEGYSNFCKVISLSVCYGKLKYDKYVGMKGYFKSLQPFITDKNGYDFFPVVLENGEKFYFVSKH